MTDWPPQAGSVRQAEKCVAETEANEEAVNGAAGGAGVLTVGTCLVELTPGDGGVSVAAASTFTRIASGAAALFACALARLETPAALLSAVGDDELGAFIVAELARVGVKTSHIRRVAGQLTSLSFASADGRGGKTFYFYRFPGFSDPLAALDSGEVPDSTLLSAQLFDFTESCIRSAGMLRQSVFDLAKRSRKLGRAVCYAPNWRPVLWRCSLDEARTVQQEAVELSDIVIMNQEEALVISGQRDLHSAIEMISQRGPRVVVVTRGGEHPALSWEGGETSEAPVFPVEVRYDVGAGDTFHAGFVSALLRGLSAAEAARFAAAAAAIKITRPPSLDTLPLRNDVEAFLAARAAP
ncbi:MAG: PfkB family carbohydrate kinase [Chloroflexi bacterium]|nr:PfkB family carbohydrate kinase [Chloroflexota bacterium]